jgi:hypothetical protein
MGFVKRAEQSARPARHGDTRKNTARRTVRGAVELETSKNDPSGYYSTDTPPWRPKIAGLQYKIGFFRVILK